MNGTTQRIVLAGREIVLVGTAHVSRESVEEVSRVVREERPDRVCVEIDEGRYRSMTEKDAWEKLDIAKVIKEGKGFLLLANLALSSFQRRLGMGLGVKPGDEMKRAIDEAAELGIPFSFCDREVQTTLRRAWARCGFWSKSKLMAALVSSALSTEKLEESEIEALKDKNELDGMMAELADYMPMVKETLIDERDSYLASRIWTSEGTKLVAVIGAGHMEGVKARLSALADGSVGSDVSGLDQVPGPSRIGKAIPWLIPVILVGLIVAGFFRSGAGVSVDMLLRWILLNGSLAALGSLLALAHPLTILVSFVGAPIATINPFIGVGLFAGVAEASLRKPRVVDMETLSDDIVSPRGFYRNRITKALLVFFLSSLGGAVGNFIALPYLTTLVVG
ncbi:MAG: conjugal transfer protein TraB [Treponema sp. GWB1_62_6]|nr:MAG: conjugal transfer protein TraB [Treponema sp. GWA1_62_8]OHE66472.1 MAG: conjugal transfer protein TraB [Treponema sp. GWC1_61_84]OHE67487.1 MAG: conjugal transfer protein TraB [Treponema sp. GWB1_62_6]HCM29117.1 TraB family protein [Treponema sp.]